MKKIFVLAIVAILASCTPAKNTEATDSTAVAADTVAVQPTVEAAADSVK